MTPTAPQDFLDAKEAELEIVAQSTSQWQAPHFVWYVLEELRSRLCGDAETCDALDQGGLRVVTTMDLGIQKSAEKWIQAATLVPHRSSPAAAARSLGVPYEAWMQRLRGQNVWNGALSAIDYQRGEIIAYVGSANYYERRKVSKKMQPQFDVLSSGWRQPGSAFKPFTYATGIDEGTLTASTMLMDVTTDFGGYVPTDFTGLERGPLRVRNALQFSLNIPAVKALAMVGDADVFERAKDFGMRFQRKRNVAGLAMALGSLEVHPLDLNQAYATIANGGRNAGLTSLLKVTDTAGGEVLPAHTMPKGERVISEQAAYVTTDILAGNTDPTVNPIWAAHRITASNGQRRPAAYKTGTNNDAKDLNAYGFIAPPSERGRARGEYALSVGVWAGNSDSSPVTTVANPVFSLDVAAPIWDAFLTDVTSRWEVRDFVRPGGLTNTAVDVFTGYQPSRWSREQVSELFINGTEPGKDPYLKGVEVVKGPDGRMYRWEDGCEGEPQTRGYLVLDKAESAYPSWSQAVQGWLSRARRGAGVGATIKGASKRTVTAYFYQPYFQPYGASWGGSFAPTRSCDLAPSASPSLSPSPSASASAAPSASPSAEASPAPEVTPQPQPTETPTPRPTRRPRPTPTPTPAPTTGPTPAPTASPTAEPTSGPAGGGDNGVTAADPTP